MPYVLFGVVAFLFENTLKRTLHVNKCATIWDFPGGPVVKTLCFQCKEHRFNTRSGTEVPVLCCETKKRFFSFLFFFKQMCNCLLILEPHKILL